MGSVDRRLRREFDAHVDSIMTPGAKQMAYAADPQWKRWLYNDWLFEREQRFAAENPPPKPEPLSGQDLIDEMRSLLNFCEGFLAGFEDDPDKDLDAARETLTRIRALPL